MRLFFRIILVFLAILGLNACYLEAELARTNPLDPRYQAPESCEDDTICGPYAFCVKGKCALPCQRNEDCSRPLVCVASRCIEEECVPCEETSECSQRRACVGSCCVACRRASDCGSRYLCSGGACVSF